MYDDEHGVALVKERCPVCWTDYEGPILLNTRIFNKAANRRVNEMHGKTIGYMKEPCKQCKEWMKVGVILIICDKEKSPDINDPYRLGFHVLKEEAITKVFEEEAATVLLKTRVAYITKEQATMFGMDNFTNKDDGPLHTEEPGTGR